MATKPGFQIVHQLETWIIKFMDQEPKELQIQMEKDHMEELVLNARVSLKRMLRILYRRKQILMLILTHLIRLGYKTALLVEIWVNPIKMQEHLQHQALKVEDIQELELLAKVLPNNKRRIRVYYK